MINELAPRSTSHAAQQLTSYRATTWLMQNGHHSRAAAGEVEIRLQAWRDDDPDTWWSGVLERNTTDSG
jgi:hypothetical protein